MEESVLKHSNEVNSEKGLPTLIQDETASPRKTSLDEMENERIPEIKDIYDHIYGNVRNKLVFYENQRTRTISGESKPRSNSRSLTPDDLRTRSSSLEVTPNSEFSFDFTEAQAGDSTPNLTSTELSELKLSLEANNFETETSKTASSVTETIPTSADPKSPPVEGPNEIKCDTESSSSSIKPDSSEECAPVVCKPKITNDSPIESNLSTEVTPKAVNSSTQNAETQMIKTCLKCEKQNFILDRTEILTEINANLKVDYEKLKQLLKLEIRKTNALNFEIANIESIFETYYKEASQQKSSFALLYSVMKSYVADETAKESYTFQRIKAISNYIENLKNKFIHQDRIIKNNFIENPYYSDLMIKHDAIIKQLDILSLENKQLVEEKSKRDFDELEAIKELNRQKFLLENKYQEMEVFYKEKVAESELKMRTMQEEHKKQVKDYEASLKQKDQERLKLENGYVAKISNYNQEMLMLYGKLNQAKVENQT